MPDKWHTLPFSRAIPANVAPVVTKRQSRMATAHTYESALICEFGELLCRKSEIFLQPGFLKAPNTG
jgi:hypothetical protein